MQWFEGVRQQGAEENVGPQEDGSKNNTGENCVMKSFCLCSCHMRLGYSKSKRMR